MDWLTIVLFFAGIGLLVIGADTMVGAAARVARRFGISSLVVGLTVVSFGTSAPELAVSIQSAFAGNPAIALGNVVGSNIANILLILGITAIIAPIGIAAGLMKRDVPIMIGISFLVWLLSANGLLGRWEGLFLSLGLIAFVIFLLRTSKPDEKNEDEDAPPPQGAKQIAIDGVLFAVGLAMLVLGANWIVNGAVTFATALGISELIVGLTIVAVGTSLPEIATSVLAGIRGQRDMAVGNIVGSNIFNILAVLGISALVAPIGIPVPLEALRFELPVMVIVALICVPIFISRELVSRREGFALLFFYGLYTVYLVLYSIGSSFAPTLLWATMVFIIPLAMIALGLRVWQSLRAERKTVNSP